MQHHAPVERNRSAHPQNHRVYRFSNKNETCCVWSGICCIENLSPHIPANRQPWSENRVLGSVKRSCCTCWSKRNSKAGAYLKRPVVPLLHHDLLQRLIHMHHGETCAGG